MIVVEFLVQVLEQVLELEPEKLEQFAGLVHGFSAAVLQLVQELAESLKIFLELAAVVVELVWELAEQGLELVQLVQLVLRLWQLLEQLRLHLLLLQPAFLVSNNSMDHGRLLCHVHMVQTQPHHQILDMR